MLFVFMFNEVTSQNYPVYNGYFANPFIYNPAAAATDRLQVNASYRRQWFGVPGAPSISSITASTLLDETRAGIGFKVSTFSRGIMNSTDASFSYAYGVPLNKSNNLFFGLSGGVLSNTLNLNGVSNSADPALANATNSFSPTASYGMWWQNNSGFNLGFVLPKLFGNQDLNTKYSFSYFDNAIVTASFSKWNPNPKFAKKGSRGKKNASKNVPLEFFSIYRYSSFGSLMEATAKYNFNSNLWLSATYRQYAGIVPGIGISKDNFSFSYFYEPGLGGSMPLKTHEILLKIQFGKDRKFKQLAPIAPASKVAINPPKAPKIISGKPVIAQKNIETKKVEPQPVVPKKVEIVKPVNPPLVVQKPGKKDSVVAHRPRFNKDIKPLGQPDAVTPVTTDTAAITKAHKDERDELDKHIEEHADGRHNDAHNEPVNERHDFVKRGTHKEELDVATYVIAGAFQSRANAEHYMKTLKGLGYADADFGHLTARNIWYVVIAEEKDVEKAKADRNELQKNKIFKNVWLLTVQP